MPFLIVCSGRKLIPFPHILLSWHTSLLLNENVSFAGPPDSHIDVVSSQLCQTEAPLVPVITDCYCISNGKAHEQAFEAGL